MRSLNKVKCGTALGQVPSYPFRTGKFVGDIDSRNPANKEHYMITSTPDTEILNVIM